MPATIRFLPARDDYPPAMITAFGFAQEPEPGVLEIEDSAVRAVHLTKLKPDGSGKADVPNPKIMIGSAPGVPLVLAPCNDLLGLFIAEGIEDALTAHCGVRLRCLGRRQRQSPARLGRCRSRFCRVRDRCGPISDAAGQRYSTELAKRLDARGIEVKWP